ncbi:MAG: glycerophosphodiester phosphodiesterase family protein [Gemmatimonadota bacterium]|nr:glycerophosphodiester phosphodiesterase family protein [Gemmatimonadota bacterium]
MILLDPDARPLVGHRGASAEYPENTTLAFDRALEQGVDALELDVRVTADGVPVVIHDPTVDRTTDGSGAVRSLVLDQLRQLDAGCGERIPTLDEVLGRYPTTPMILEIKEVEVAADAIDVLRRHSATPRILVGSFEHRALAPFTAAGFHRSASRRETVLCWAAARLRLTFPGFKFEAFTVPEQQGALTVVDAAFLNVARQAGRPVHVWTVDDPARARRLRAAGVSGIITNQPSKMHDL